MQKRDDSKRLSPEENAEVFRSHFEKLPLYNSESYSTYQCSYQRPVMNSISLILDEEEVKKAALRLKNKAPRASGLTAQMFKSLARCIGYLKNIIVDIWVNEFYPPQWDTTGQLVILFLAIIEVSCCLKLPTRC